MMVKSYQIFGSELHDLGIGQKTKLILYGDELKLLSPTNKFFYSFSKIN
jgi:hypothetical protein